MDLSNLESKSKAFESSIDSLSTLLAIATGLVVVGLVLEYRKEVAEIIRTKPFPWAKLEHLIGAALVTLGVAGELIFQPYMETAENSLRSVSHEVESELSKETEDARARAESARRDAERIRQQAAITEERLLAERRLTANERRRLLRVERAVLPRSSLINASELSAELKAGHFGKINVASVSKAEPAMFVYMTLMPALSSAGILGQVLPLPKNTDVSGVTVMSSDPDDHLAQMLSQKFRIGGGTGMQMPRARKVVPALNVLPSDETCLMVGEKDEALQGMPGQPGEGLDRGSPDPMPH